MYTHLFLGLILSSRQTQDPLRGIYDAIFRPNRPPSSSVAPLHVPPRSSDTAEAAAESFTTATASVAKSNKGNDYVSDLAKAHAAPLPAPAKVIATAPPAVSSVTTKKLKILETNTFAMEKPALGKTEGRVFQPAGDDAAGIILPFLPEERLTLEEAVWMYTGGGAFAAGEEDRLGVIRPGFLADLTVVEVEGGAASLQKDNRSDARVEEE